MRFDLIVAAAALGGLLATPAAAQTDTQRILNRLRTGQTTSSAPLPPPTAAGPITAEPMHVVLEKDMGQDRTFTIFPNRIVVAGYNVGGFRTAKTTGHASGGILNTNAGASTTVELVAWGIDAPLLTRIASAAHADLVTQLKEAGFEVVSLEDMRVTDGFDKLRLGGEPYEVKVPADRGNMEGLVVGPALTGVRGNYPLAKTEFGSFGAPVLSLNLNAMVVMPNLMFDFAWLSSSRSRGFTANASSGLRFGINPGWSRMRVMASRRKEFLEGDFLFRMDGEAYSDAGFGSVSDSSQSDNSGQQALGYALGVGVRARSKESSAVSIDQARYEALALSAARGWNTGFVTALRARTGR